MVKTLRDLLPGAPHPDEELATFRAALEPTEWVAYVDPLKDFTTRLPGDDLSTHPLASTASNPLPGTSLLEMAVMIREGRMTADVERSARVYLDQYRKLTGETMLDDRNHQPIASTEQGTADYDTVSPAQSGGLHRVDPFDLGDFQWGDHHSS